MILSPGAHAIKMVEKINAFRRIHGGRSSVCLIWLFLRRQLLGQNLIRKFWEGEAETPRPKYGQDVCIAPKGDKDVSEDLWNRFFIKTVSILQLGHPQAVSEEQVGVALEISTTIQLFFKITHLQITTPGLKITM